MQVVLIFALAGACRSIELNNLKIDNVQFVSDSEINIGLKNTKNNGTRDNKIVNSGSFDYVGLVKKYNELANKVDVRKKGNSFFITYRMGVCVNSRMGRNRFGEIFKEVATFLKLPHPEHYTGHSGRRSSASICATKSATEVQLKSLGGWKHLKTACRYVADNEQLRRKNAAMVLGFNDPGAGPSHAPVPVSSHAPDPSEEVIAGDRSFIPDESNISNPEIDETINSLTEIILAAVDKAIPLGERGGKRIWILSGTVDYWFKERRRIKRLLTKSYRKLNADQDRIAQLKRSIAAATAEITKEINIARDNAIDVGGNIFSAIKERNTCGHSKRELSLKDEAGNILSTTAEKQSTLSNFYEELYRGRTLPCNQLCDVLEWKCDVAEFTSLAKFSSANKAINPNNSEFANFTIY